MSSDSSHDARTEYHPPPEPSRGGAGDETVDLGPGGIPKRIGPYELLGILGQGGMGAVYKARDPSLDREVALKVLPPQVSADSEEGERFLREARVAAKINSPHVITVHAVGEEGGRPYMALELVKGGDADALAKNSPDGRLPERRALELIRDCARGLVAIERAGLVHRDIKPANVFLTEDGLAKLADLGLARSHSGEDQLTQTGTIVGTPAYMAPEQARGDPVDIRTDVYALGATLYGLVTGQAPYQGSSVFVIVSNVLNEPMPDPQQVRPDLSSATADLIRRACAKEPSDRFGSAKALLAGVEHALETAPRGRRIGAARPSPQATRARGSAPTVPLQQTRPARPSGRAVVAGPVGDVPAPLVETSWRRKLLVGGGVTLLSCCVLGGIGDAMKKRQRRAVPPPPVDVAETSPTPSPSPTSDGGGGARPTGMAALLRWEATDPGKVIQVADPSRVIYEPGPGRESKVRFLDRRDRPWPVPEGGAGPEHPEGSLTTLRAVWTIHGVEVLKPPGFAIGLGLRRRNTPFEGKQDVGPSLYVDLGFRRGPLGPGVAGRAVVIDARGRKDDLVVMRPFLYDPALPLVVAVDVNLFGWNVFVQHQEIVRGGNGLWQSLPNARMRDTLEPGVYLFAAMGNRQSGHGKGGLSLQVVERQLIEPDPSKKTQRLRDEPRDRPRRGRRGRLRRRGR